MIFIYSWEISNFLNNKNYELTKYEYMNITDIELSPQIRRIKYEPYSNSFYMETYDGYNWTFRIKE